MFGASPANLASANSPQNSWITLPFASTPVAREISVTSKGTLSPEDVHPFPKPGPRCDIKQRKKIKFCILTDYAINYCIEPGTLARATV